MCQGRETKHRRTEGSEQQACTRIEISHNIPVPPTPRRLISPALRRLLSPLRLTTLLIGGLLLASGALAQPLDVRGYAKTLGLRSASPLDDAPFYLDITRGRVQVLADAGLRLHAEVWLDTEVLVGNYLRTDLYTLSQALPRRTWLDLDWTVAQTDDVVLQQQLFRAFVTLYLGQTHLTVGHQRIAWGTGFVWNPTDLLNPLDPAALERDEKTGVDAAYLAIPFGALSRVEAVAAPGRTRDQASAALRVSTHVGEYDLAAMSGWLRDQFVLGGDFAGYVGDAGLRGEAAVTWENGERSLRLTVNADYTFASGYYVLAEVHHNGPGTRQRHAYDRSALLTGTIFNVAKEYGALSVSKDLTPLVYLVFYGLVNLNDGSSLVGPAVQWSLAENLDLAASTYLFVGAQDTEFGAQHHVFFASLHYYF